MQRAIDSKDAPRVALFKNSFRTINALEYAAFIARVTGRKLIILHITKDRESIKTQLNETKALPFLKGVNVEVVIRKGKSLSKTINSVGLKFEAELIIMGSNGVSNLGELILGSDTENVIRKIKE